MASAALRRISEFEQYRRESEAEIERLRRECGQLRADQRLLLHVIHEYQLKKEYRAAKTEREESDDVE